MTRLLPTCQKPFLPWRTPGELAPRRSAAGHCSLRGGAMCGHRPCEGRTESSTPTKQDTGDAIPYEDLPWGGVSSPRPMVNEGLR